MAADRNTTEILNLSQAAGRMGVEESTIQRYAKLGLLVPEQLSGGPGFKLEDLLQLFRPSDSASGTITDGAQAEMARSSNEIQEGSEQIIQLQFEVPEEGNSEEALLSSLQNRIEILLEERNWLRERILTLETRAERDQMLRLSENDLLGRMLLEDKRRAEKRPRLMRALLPSSWFGDGKNEG